MFSYTRRSSLAVAASKALPPVASAIWDRASWLTGTGMFRPSTATVPSLVPKAMVDTWTLASDAALLAASLGRPTVVSPSDMRTIRPGAGAWPGSVGTDWMAARLAKMASPMAVRGPSWRVSIPRLSRAWSVVGETRTWAVPENETSPMLSRLGTMSTKALAASWAATSRLGWTSVASMDSEVSMAMTTVARSRGTFTGRAGWAKAVTRAMRDRTNAAAGMWRRQLGRFGAIESRRLRLV